MASGGVSSKAGENEGDSWTLGEGARNAGNARMAMEKDDGNVDQDERREVKTMHSIELESKDHMMVLDKLNFKEDFMEKHAGFEEKFRYLEKGSKFYLEICCTNKMKNEIWETLTQFTSCVKCVRLDQNVQALLSLKNYQYVSLLEKELHDKQLNSLVKMQEKTFIIYTKEENEKKVKDVVASLFLWETVPSLDPKYFYFTTPEFQKYRKEHENIDFKFEREAGAISFAVVKSVSDELMKALKDYDSGQQDFELSPSQKEVIQKWGNSKIGELQNWQWYNQLHSEGRYITTRKALLLKEKPTEEYIKKKLESLKIMALFEVESDDCVNLIGLNAKEAERAEKCFEDSICEVPFCYNDKILEDIDSKEFKEFFDIWKGKFVFEGLKEAKSEAEGSLFATDDVIDRLQKFLFSNFSHNKNGTVFTKPIIHPDLCAKFESQDNLLEIGKKHNCQISKKYLGSLLANCWLLGKTNHDYFRVHLVAGHAESLNVDAVVCPCTSVMFPVNDCFGMYRDMMRVKSTVKKHKVNHIEEILAPDEFRCERIMYLVTCEPNNAEKADIGTIVKNALLKADELSCKSLAIPVVLQPESIMEKKTQAKQIAIAIRNRPNLETLEEVFVCECSDHPSIPIEKLWEKLFCETERYINFKPLQESAVRMATPLREFTHIPAINVKIINDTLVSQQVEVIVNTCRKDLDLTQGTVSQTILKTGGKSIQGELRKNYDKLRFGEIAVTKGGLLPCNYIFHGALYNWTPVGDFSLKVLKLMVWNCLAEADKLNCSSIAFPSLGTGNLGHPFHLVAETMYHTIQCYEQCHSDTKIKNISIVLYKKDKECIHQFETVEKMKENLFQSREECHPTQYLTCKKILASNPVTVDLLPSLSTWKWGSLLKLTFCPGGNGKGLIWDPINLCWNLKINPPPGWVASKLTWESYFEKESLDILNKRITSIELSLSNGTDGYKEQIEDFFKIMNDKDHFIKHLFIVFPNITFDELKKESERIEGHWKLGRKLDDFPITYMLSGSPQDVSRAKAEIDDMITKGLVLYINRVWKDKRRTRISVLKELDSVFCVRNDLEHQKQKI